MRIRFCSPVKSHIGYGELGRVVVNQLVEAGHDVSVEPLAIEESNLDFGELGRQSLQRIGGGGRFDVNIVNMIPRFFERYRLPGALNIGYTMFEADRIPDDWVQACNRMDAIWVPASWVRDVFAASGVTVPISVVGIDAVERPVAQPGGTDFRIVSMFHWTSRKNPVALLRAYFAAFDGRKDTVLVLKAHMSSGVNQAEAYLRNAVSGVAANIRPRSSLPRVELITRLMTTAEIHALHEGSHASFSMSHGEGWGLPAWEAALAGKPVLHTGWSAPTEFVAEAGQIRYNLAPVYGMNDFVPFYDNGMRWADPHIDDAVDRLRDLYSHYGNWQQSAAAHRLALNERYAMPRRLAALDEALQPGPRRSG